MSVCHKWSETPLTSEIKFREELQKDSGYIVFGTKGGMEESLFEKFCNSEKGVGAKIKRNPYTAEN